MGLKGVKRIEKLIEIRSTDFDLVYLEKTDHFGPFLVQAKCTIWIIDLLPDFFFGGWVR